jgi:hypothetical protein
VRAYALVTSFPTVSLHGNYLCTSRHVATRKVFKGHSSPDSGLRSRHSEDEGGGEERYRSNCQSNGDNLAQARMGESCLSSVPSP